MKFALRALCAAALFSVGSASHADLNRHGPVNSPSPPGHGFPKWYQDLNGLVLDLCLPNESDPGGLQKTACLMETDPPYTFPTSFPDESFYFRAVSAPLDMGGDRRAILVLALEAAFTNGVAQPGEQMVFTRIRVTAGVPHTGKYKVRHPYGEETFDAVSSGGNRDIVFTEDIGLSPGDFSQALTSRFGPFLQAVDAQGAVKRVDLNGATFLSDGVTLERLTGGPYGNAFSICGPFDGSEQPERCVETDLFTLTGRLHDSAADPIPSPLEIRRATYSRDATGARVDVVANAVAGIGAQAPLLSAGAKDLPPVKLAGPDVLKNYYAHAIPVGPGAVPAEVSVVNSGDTPPSMARRHIVDEVRITSARYDPDARQLVVTATSSDKGGADETAPALVLEGYAAQSLREAIPDDPASHRFVVDGLDVPPSAVTVASAAGGRDRVPVSMGRGAAFPPGVPLAVDDVATATAGSETPTVVEVLVNDIAHPAAPLTVGSLTLLDPLVTPMGTLSSTGDGKLSFLPSTTTGTATFRYTVANSVGTSNPGLLSVNVVPGASGPVPIANADPSSGASPINVPLNSSTVIDVLANDSANDPSGVVTLNPSSVSISSPPSTGEALVDTSSGKVTYKSANTAATVNFSYTVSNTNGNMSAPATVTVNVLAPDQVTVTSARCVRGKRSWEVRGTSSVTTGNSVTIYLTSTVPSDPTAEQTLGTAPVDALGEFRLQVQNGPSCVSPISLKSALGTTVNGIAVQLKN